MNAEQTGKKPCPKRSLQFALSCLVAIAIASWIGCDQAVTFLPNSGQRVRVASGEVEPTDTVAYRRGGGAGGQDVLWFFFDWAQAEQMAQLDFRGISVVG